MVKLSFKINTKPLAKFQNALEEDIHRGGNGPIGKAFEAWGRLYTEYLHDRFYSGGGDKPWVSLSPLTINRKGHGVILYDSGTLQGVFTVGNSALRITRITNGVVLSVVGGSHPNSKLSIEQLIEVHQNGLGRVPVRRIMVPPSPAVQKQSKTIMMKAVSQLIRESKLD